MRSHPTPSRQSFDKIASKSKWRRGANWNGVEDEGAGGRKANGDCGVKGRSVRRKTDEGCAQSVERRKRKCWGRGEKERHSSERREIIDVAKNAATWFTLRS